MCLPGVHRGPVKVEQPTNSGSVGRALAGCRKASGESEKSDTFQLDEGDNPSGEKSDTLQSDEDDGGEYPSTLDANPKRKTASGGNSVAVCFSSSALLITVALMI